MSEVFKVRFDGREWWAWHQQPIRRLWLYGSRQQAVSGLGDWTHAFSTLHAATTLSEWPSVVERVEELPPEPPAGTVLWDEDDVACVRDHDLWTRYSLDGDSTGLGETLTWRVLSRKHGPLHPYPRAAREEIERLTARIDGALRYVANPGNWSALDQRPTDLDKTLRGES